MRIDQKFTFDAHFPIPDPEGNIELYDVKVAREKGEKEGYEKGYQAGYLEANQKLENLLAHILKDLEGLNEKFSAVRQSMESEILQLSFAMVQKLFPYFIKQGGFSEIQQVVQDALEREEEKAYTIYVNESTLALLKDKIKETNVAFPTDGMVVFKGDNGLSDTDCRIEWKTGGLERMINRLNQEIKAAVTRLIPEGHLMAKIDGLDGESHITNSKTK